MGELRQFQSLTAYEFIYHHPIIDESKEGAVSVYILASTVPLMLVRTQIFGNRFFLSDSAR